MELKSGRFSCREADRNVDVISHICTLKFLAATMAQICVGEYVKGGSKQRGSL